MEHLRTVHFTLIVVAVGLIFLSYPRYDANKALNEVESIISLKNTWSLKWLVDLGLQGGQEHGKIEGTKLLVTPDSLGVTVKSDGQTRRFRFPKNNRLISYDDGRVYNPEPGHLDEDFVSPFPDTIEEFENWWDRLYQRPVYVNLPNEISNNVTVFGEDSTQKGLSDVQLITDGQQLSPSSGDLEMQPVEAKGHLTAAAGLRYYHYDAQKRQSFYFPITTTSFRVMQTDISKFQNWKSGTFQATFPELAKASGGVEQLSLERLKARLSQEADRGPDILEIFGLKIRADQLVGAGTTLLLAIQLYFFVHLKELNRKLSPQDGCWDVPWLGMYQDRLSRFLYVVTTGILPAFVIVLLFRQTLRSLVGLGHTPRPAASNIAGVCVALVLSISFGWLSWKYRPQAGSA